MRHQTERRRNHTAYAGPNGNGGRRHTTARHQRKRISMLHSTYNTNGNGERRYIQHQRERNRGAAPHTHVHGTKRNGNGTTHFRARRQTERKQHHALSCTAPNRTEISPCITVVHGTKLQGTMLRGSPCTHTHFICFARALALALLLPDRNQACLPS